MKNMPVRKDDIQIYGRRLNPNIGKRSVNNPYSGLKHQGDEMIAQERVISEGVKPLFNNVKRMATLMNEKQNPKIKYAKYNGIIYVLQVN